MAAERTLSIIKPDAVAKNVSWSWLHKDSKATVLRDWPLQDEMFVPSGG